VSQRSALENDALIRKLIAYAKGDCYRLTAIIRRLGATGKTPKWKEVVRALGGGL